jgi:hypothetical protein
MWSQPKVSTWKNTTSIEQFERLLWQEIKAGNWLEVESHLASQYTNTSDLGVMDKTQTLAQLKKLALTDYSIGDVNVTSHGDTAIITYIATVQGTRGCAPFNSEQHRRMSVWQQHKSGWVVIAQSDLGAAQ